MLKIETIDFNLELRGKVLEDSLNLEKLASDVMKSVLRIFKRDTKTFGNKSSSLSFKNKIDLLFDIGELDKSKYLNLIKFMEIRNQFIHNHECNSFEDLESINPELSKHLKKFTSDKSTKDELYTCYQTLYMHCLGTLYILDREYNWGIEGDFKKYIGVKIISNFDSLINQSVEKFGIAQQDESFASEIDTPAKQIAFFVDLLKMELMIKQLEELKKLESSSNQELIYRRKIEIEQKLKK